MAASSVNTLREISGVPLLARAEFGEALADPRGNARSARGRQRNGQLVIESKSP
jgi:hypothetical protein